MRLISLHSVAIYTENFPGKPVKSSQATRDCRSLGKRLSPQGDGCERSKWGYNIEMSLAQWLGAWYLLAWAGVGLSFVVAFLWERYQKGRGRRVRVSRWRAYQFGAIFSFVVAPIAAATGILLREMKVEFFADLFVSLAALSLLVALPQIAYVALRVSLRGGSARRWRPRDWVGSGLVMAVVCTALTAGGLGLGKQLFNGLEICTNEVLKGGGDW
jgi:hypothetical protein